MSDFKVKGLAELERALDALPARMEKNVARGALRAGGAVFREEARRLAPVKSGALQKSIRVVSARMRQGMLRLNIVAGRSGKDQPWYAKLVEFGTPPHKITAAFGSALAIAGKLVASVQHPGAAPKPFMRPAFDTKGKEAVEAFRDYTAKRLAKLTGRS